MKLRKVELLKLEEKHCKKKKKKIAEFVNENELS
jgi:hypothetical protein